MDTALIEGLGIIEPGRVVDRDLRTEASISYVGPVTDVAFANSDQVGQAVAGHVGEIDRLCPISEHNARPFLLVEWARNIHAWPEALLCVGLVPGGKRLILGDEDVCMA